MAAVFSCSGATGAIKSVNSFILPSSDYHLAGTTSGILFVKDSLGCRETCVELQGRWSYFRNDDHPLGTPSHLNPLTTQIKNRHQTL